MTTSDVLTRRTLLSAFGFLAAGAAGVPAQAQSLRKVRIAVGTNVLNVTYPWLTLPLIKGWWRSQGYDVEVIPVGASLQALQQLVAGNVEFAQLNSSVVIQANVVNAIPVRAVLNTGILDWAIGVPEDSNIRQVQDLKGKMVGVFSLATGGIAFMKAYLAECGMNPDKDVQIIALGLGAPAIDALKNNRVQAVLYWGAALAGFENAGLKLRYFQGPDWSSYPDFTFATLQKTTETTPDMVEAIARGATEAMVFTMANPDCQRQLHWEHYPNSKPTGADEATLVRWDTNNLRMQIAAIKGSFTINGGMYWGAATPGPYGKIQDFMLRAGLIPKAVDPQTYMVTIPDFYRRVNDFDASAIQAEAVACHP
jgi:NitT/TauT family transport system substrate-binding protein